MKNKKSALTLEYTFIIVISLIAVFVIIGLITSWSFSAKTMMCKLSGSCSDEKRVDRQTVKLEGCEEDEIIKYSKLCLALVNENKIKQGEICYVLDFTGSCRVDESRIKTALSAYISADKVEIGALSDNVIIEYDFGSNKLVIS